MDNKEVLMYCTKCGKQIPDDSQFCSFCGDEVTVGNSTINQYSGRNDISILNKEAVFFKSYLFSFKGRRNRLPYFLTALTLHIIFNFLIKLAVSNRLSSGTVLVLYLACLFFSYIHMTNIAKRLQDLNINGYLAIPVVIVSNILLFVRKEFGLICMAILLVLGLILIFKKGTLGDNNYGTDPLKK